MSVDIYDVVYIVGNLFMTYVIYKFMEIFYTEKSTGKKIVIWSYVIYFIVISTLHILVKVPIVLMISNIGLFYMLTLNYKSSIKKRVFTSIMIYLALMCIEMIIVFATGYFKLELLERNNYESILGIIIIRVVSYVAVLIIGKSKNIRQGDIVPNTYWLCIVTIPMGTLYLLITIFMASELTFISVLMSTVIVLVINFATFYLYDDLSKILLDKADKIFMNQQNKYYERQFELMKTSLKATKSIKHDLKNHLISLYALAEEDKKEELLGYLSEAIEIVDTKQEFACTGNIGIDSIINFKLQNVKKDEIDVTIDLNVPKEIKVPSFDITVILGNLLDNALNAVKKLDKNRFINIKMKYTKGRLIIKMDNSFDGIIIKQEGVIFTSNKDERNHGLGLENVKSALEKYNGTIEFKYDDRNFHTTLLMYVD
nr:GHKL domain-containing protein [Sedimentibacter sp.]